MPTDKQRNLLSLSLVTVVCVMPAFSAEPQSKKECTAGSAHECEVSIVNPHAACIESEKVIDTLKHMAALLAKGDIEAYSEYLADGCTTFDEETHKLIAGKEAVIADLKKRLYTAAPDGKEPVLTLTIEEPYAKVNGDVAVVTFKAIKELGGSHPDKEEVHATDVFVKHGEKWQKLHFRGKWKKIS